MPTRQHTTALFHATNSLAGIKLQPKLKLCANQMLTPIPRLSLKLRPEAQSLIPKVTMQRVRGYEGQPSWTAAYNQVEVHLNEGRVLSERADRRTEAALRGVTMEEIVAKFREVPTCFEV